MNSRSCVICGKQFIPSHKQTLCCSDTCARIKSARSKTMGKFIACVICNKPVWQFPSNSTRKYCSLECRNTAYKEDKKRHQPKSPEWKKHISEGKIGLKIPSRHKPAIIGLCEFCHKKIDISRSANGGSSRGKYHRRFCSVECWYNFIRIDPNNHPCYQGGRENSRGNNWTRQRKLALKRDNYHCRSCNKSIRQIQLVVHHITPRSDMRDTDDWSTTNKLSNLITLCVSCHMKAEYHKIAYPLPLL